MFEIGHSAFVTFLKRRYKNPVVSEFKSIGKAIVRDSLGMALAALGVTSPARAAGGTWLIATFHRVLPEELRRRYPMPGLAVTPDELDATLNFFKKHYKCVSISEGSVVGPHMSRRDRPILTVTFDDGQKDNLNFALPVLEKHGIKATFFATSQALDDPSPLWHDRVGLRGRPGFEGRG